MSLNFHGPVGYPVSSRYKKSKFQISGLVPAPVEYKSGLNVFVAEVSKFLVFKVISKIIRYRPKIFSQPLIGQGRLIPFSHWLRAENTIWGNTLDENIWELFRWFSTSFPHTCIWLWEDETSVNGIHKLIVQSLTLTSGLDPNCLDTRAWAEDLSREQLQRF